MKTRAATPGPAPCSFKKFQSTYLSEKSCGRARIMIIPLKVKIPLSLENTSEMSLETRERASSFDG